FSSRRRHTRFSRDWSSDVCSSDLVSTDSIAAFSTMANLGGLTYLSGYGEDQLLGDQMVFGRLIYYRSFGSTRSLFRMPLYVGARSEERRVGKACRSRRSAGDLTDA